MEVSNTLPFYPHLHLLRTHLLNCIITSFTIKLDSLSNLNLAEVRYNDAVPSGFNDGSTGKPGDLVPYGDQFNPVPRDNGDGTYTFFTTATPGLSLYANSSYWLVVSFSSPTSFGWTVASTDSITVDRMYYDLGDYQVQGGRGALMVISGCGSLQTYPSFTPSPSAVTVSPTPSPTISVSPSISPTTSPLACGVHVLADTMGQSRFGDYDFLSFYPLLNSFQTNRRNCLITAFTIKLSNQANLVSAELRHNDNVTSGFNDGLMGKPGDLLPLGDQFYSTPVANGDGTFSFYTIPRSGIALPTQGSYWFVLNFTRQGASGSTGEGVQFVWTADATTEIAIGRAYYYKDSQFQVHGGRSSMIKMIGCCDPPTPSPTPSRTPPRSPTGSRTPTRSPTPTVSITSDITRSASPSFSTTPSVTPSNSPSASFSPSATPSATQSVTPSPSASPSPTVSPTPSTSPFALPVAIAPGQTFTNGPPDVEVVSMQVSETTSDTQCAGNVVVGMSGTGIDFSYFIRLTANTTGSLTVMAYVIDMSAAPPATLGQADVTAGMPTAANDSYTQVLARISTAAGLVAPNSYWLPFCFTTTTVTTRGQVAHRQAEGSIGIGGVSSSGGKTTVGVCSGGPSCKPAIVQGSLATKVVIAASSDGGDGDTIAIAAGVAVPVALAVAGFVACAVAYIAYKRYKSRLAPLPPARRRSSVRHATLEREVQRLHDSEMLEMVSTENRRSLNRQSWVSA